VCSSDLFHMFYHESRFSPIMSLNRSSDGAYQYQLDFGSLPWSSWKSPPEGAPLPQASADGPRYPDDLRANDMDGDVLVRFVIDSAGLADQETIRVLQSSHAEFTSAVLKYLRHAHFKPAYLDHHAVCAIVDMPFEFRLTR